MAVTHRFAIGDRVRIIAHQEISQNTNIGRIAIVTGLRDHGTPETAYCNLKFVEAPGDEGYRPRNGSFYERHLEPYPGIATTHSTWRTA